MNINNYEVPLILTAVFLVTWRILLLIFKNLLDIHILIFEYPDANFITFLYGNTQHKPPVTVHVLFWKLVISYPKLGNFEMLLWTMFRFIRWKWIQMVRSNLVNKSVSFYENCVWHLSRIWAQEDTFRLKIRQENIRILSGTKK